MSTIDAGVIVQVTDNIRGLIPQEQAAEIPLRNLSKKFPASKAVKCMVRTLIFFFLVCLFSLSDFPKYYFFFVRS